MKIDIVTFFYTLFSIGLFSFTAGVLGTFVLLRRESMLGDTLAHASFPGVVLSVLITQSKYVPLLLFGGALSSIVGALLILLLTVKTTMKKETIFGVILSSFFGLGLVLVTVIQKLHIGAPGIMHRFLFGNVATMLMKELIILSVCALLVLCIVHLCFKEFLLHTFDAVYTHTTGYRAHTIEFLLYTLIVIIILLGIQFVGVILASSVLIAPAAAARQWVQRTSSMAILSGIFGSTAALTGTAISCVSPSLPPGPIIIIVMSIILCISIFCAPQRSIA
jgi:manganese/zinc/iron transport system permease protein